MHNMSEENGSDIFGNSRDIIHAHVPTAFAAAGSRVDF
jgi:hypothetical protein